MFGNWSTSKLCLAECNRMHFQQHIYFIYVTKLLKCEICPLQPPFCLFQWWIWTQRAAGLQQVELLGLFVKARSCTSLPIWSRVQRASWPQTARMQTWMTRNRSVRTGPCFPVRALGGLHFVLHGPWLCMEKAFSTMKWWIMLINWGPAQTRQAWKRNYR